MMIKELDPAYELWQHYQPETSTYAFKASTLADAQSWQRQTRQALTQTLGFQHDTVQGTVEVKERVDKGSYWRHKIHLRTSEHSLMPVYVLIPKGAPQPLPTVIALHGHGYGVKDIVGKWEDGSDREAADGIYRDFAVALCERGFAVAAPEIACFGERQTDFTHLAGDQQAPTSCMHAAMLASHLGGSLLGLRIRDCRRLIDYLEDQPMCDSKRISVMGISGGGMLGFFCSCLDERIKSVVISGYFSSFKDSILAMQHCACNYVPGLSQFGEMSDLLGLIAPRPFFVEAGTHDPIFPLTAVKDALSQGQQVYKVFDAESMLGSEFFEGRHRIHGAGAYDFLSAFV